jgi:hypothetical protein
MQIIAMDELTKRMQSDPDYVPPSEVVDGLCSPRAVTGPYLDSAYSALSMVASKPIVKKLVKQIVNVSLNRLFADSPARLAIIVKRVLPSLRGKQLASIVNYCVRIAESQPLPPAVMDLFTTIADKGRFLEALGKCMQVAGYSAAAMAEATAVQAFAWVEDTSDAVNVVPRCEAFYQLFNAVVVCEKKHRKMGHERLMERYTGVYRRALELLTVPKLRIFAPMFAMFPEDVPVPGVIEEFLRENEEKIVRLHVVDEYHEW